MTLYTEYRLLDHSTGAISIILVLDIDHVHSSGVRNDHRRYPRLRGFVSGRLGFGMPDPMKFVSLIMFIFESTPVPQSSNAQPTAVI